MLVGVFIPQWPKLCFTKHGETKTSIKVPWLKWLYHPFRINSPTPWKGWFSYGFRGKHIHRRKFRSETSDNMDSWKAEVRRVRREEIRRKKIQVREKVGTSRFTVFFQWFVAPEGRKVGSLKRRVRSQLARWEMKNCTPLWHEAHFQVKMYKTPQLRTTFGSWDVEKAHAVVVRSTFPSQNAQSTPGPDHFWKLRCRKSARRCGAKHISKSKCTKHQVRTTFGSWCRKSARRCGAKHISKSKVLKTDGLGPLLEVQMSKKCRKSARRCGAKHISKSKV